MTLLLALDFIKSLEFINSSCDFIKSLEFINSSCDFIKWLHCTV